MSLLDKIFGNCAKGIHKYEPMLISKTVPTMHGLSFKGYGSLEDAIDALSDKVWEIRCVRCGKKPEEDK